MTRFTGGRRPAPEYLAGIDAGRLADFVAANGGRAGSEVTGEEAAALRILANLRHSALAVNYCRISYRCELGFRGFWWQELR
jgi:hypothetical protein